MKRLVVLAFSEASPQLIDKYCAAGVMPYLSDLRKTAALAHTRYHVPFLLTPQMWATILTGRGAGSHGIFDYWQRNCNGVFIETHGGDIRGPCVWDVLEAHGVASGVVNVPLTYPPPRTSAFAISGQDAPGPHVSMTWPPELYKELEYAFGPYHHKDIFPGPYDKSNYGAVIHAETMRQIEVFAYLLARSDWHFMILYASATAFAQHYFWDDIDKLSAPDVVKCTFADVDAMIRRTHSDLRSGDALIIMSECGAGPLVKGVRLNSWLEQEGLLARRRANPGLRARLLRSARTAAPQYIPRRLLHVANRSPLKRWMQELIVTNSIDWRRTLAFHRGKGEGNIYINLVGRDPNGIVARADYESLREKIISSLLTLIDPSTGRPAARGVHRREELFNGEIETAPDLIVEWEDFQYMPAESLDTNASVFGPRIREYMSWPTTGSHRPEGFFLAASDEIGLCTLDAPVDLLDLAPTWLDFLGVPKPDFMEGKSILPQIRARRTASTL